MVFLVHAWYIDWNVTITQGRMRGERRKTWPITLHKTMIAVWSALKNTQLSLWEKTYIFCIICTKWTLCYSIFLNNNLIFKTVFIQERIETLIKYYWLMTSHILITDKLQPQCVYYNIVNNYMLICYNKTQTQ